MTPQNVAVDTPVLGDEEDHYGDLSAIVADDLAAFVRDEDRHRSLTVVRENGDRDVLAVAARRVDQLRADSATEDMCTAMRTVLERWTDGSRFSQVRGVLAVVREDELGHRGLAAALDELLSVRSKDPRDFWRMVEWAARNVANNPSGPDRSIGCTCDGVPIKRATPLPRAARPGPGPESDAYDSAGAGQGEDEERDSWAPQDLASFLDGTYEPLRPSLGARRSDGEHFLYAGLEHAVLGLSEAGKGWWSLAHVAAELMAGNRVVYVHFEESCAAETTLRLHRQFRVPAARLLDDFLFIGPERQVSPPSIARLVADRVPTLVILDGQNEAMALHAQKINDPDGAAAFRSRLAKPFTRCGAAVLTMDHVVKSPEQNGQGYALGSVHKINGINGAVFLLENVEPFGKGLDGATMVSVSKDRPGELRRLGRPTNVARKAFLGMMHIADSAAPWSWRWEPPAPTDGGEDPEFARMRQDRRHAALDDKVLAAIAEMNARQQYPSKSVIHGRLGGRKADVLAAVDRLEGHGRVGNQSVGSAGAYAVLPQTGSQ